MRPVHHPFQPCGGADDERGVGGDGDDPAAREDGAVHLHEHLLVVLLGGARPREGLAPGAVGRGAVADGVGGGEAEPRPV